MQSELPSVIAERERVRDLYQRRDRDNEGKVPWDPATIFKDAEKKRWAAILLYRAGVFPKAEDQCLEVGFGSLGWLGDLVTWGVRERNLHGIELVPGRVQRAREILPLADLRVGDATKLPWESGTFSLVVASTVFSSIFDAQVSRLLAEEITRILAPNGALLWYDVALNPRTHERHKIGRREVMRLFPQLSGTMKWTTLLPPLARFLVPKSWTLATCLAAVPLLRTHLLGVLVKRP
jgi:SAM-dependent methyltransferase